MQNIKEYLKSIQFSLSFSWRFVFVKTLIIVALVMIGGILPYGSSFLLGKLVNIVVAGAKAGSYTGIWYVLILYAFIGALPTILGNIRSYINRNRWLILQMETEVIILKRREEIDIATYENPKFQDLLQRAFRNGWEPLASLADSQFDALSAITSLVAGTILAIHFNPYIYLVVILTAVPSFLVDIKYATRSWSISKKDSPERRRLQDLRQHIHYRTFLIETKLFQSGRKIISWMRNILVDFMNIQLGLEKRRLFDTTITDVIAFAGFAFGLFLILRSVINGEILVGSLVYMMGTLSIVRGSISTLLTSVANQYDKHLTVKDIMEFMDTQPVVIESKNPHALTLKTAPEIVFEDVSFKYPGSETWSLQHINMTLRPGHKIGLVGNNGAGKTTFVKLLCRIYDPTEGRILINGIDLRDVATAEWWSYLAIMFQDYASYDFSVKEAIAIGRPDAPLRLDKVVESAQTAQAHTFIEEWKDTYNQQLGVEFGGKEPSKGQRQKLSIAKTLYRNGFIMILDEPTASVDAESEAKIFDSLERLSDGTTAILISHDFSTISQCDHIFVFEKGGLREEGSHKELMKLKGMYADLYNLQAERFKK